MIVMMMIIIILVIGQNWPIWRPISDITIGSFENQA